MLIVNVAVPGDEFVAIVHEISAWLDAAQISTPYSAFSGDKVHRTIRLGFDRDGEAELFAKRFGGNVLPDGPELAAAGGRAAACVPAEILHLAQARPAASPMTNSASAAARAKRADFPRRYRLCSIRMTIAFHFFLIVADNDGGGAGCAARTGPPPQAPDKGLCGAAVLGGSRR